MTTATVCGIRLDSNPLSFDSSFIVHRSSFRRQPIQNLDTAFDGAVTCRVTYSEMRVVPAERITGDDEEIIADGFRDKLRSRSPWSFRKHVEGTARPGHFVSTFQAIHQAITFSLIVRDNAGHVIVPRDGAGILDHARRTHVTVVLEFEHLLNDAAWPVCKTQAPTGHAIGFAEAVEDEDTHR